MIWKTLQPIHHHKIGSLSDAFISKPGIHSMVHVITPMGYDYGYESSTELSDSGCIIISLQNVKAKGKANKRPLNKCSFASFKGY